MEYAVLAIVLAFDLLIVKWKFEHGRFADAILDVSLLVVINYALGGSLGGEMIGTIAAFIISIYLLIFPPNLSKLIA